MAQNNTPPHVGALQTNSVELTQVQVQVVNQVDGRTVGAPVHDGTAFTHTQCHGGEKAQYNMLYCKVATVTGGWDCP